MNKSKVQLVLLLAVVLTVAGCFGGEPVPSPDPDPNGPGEPEVIQIADLFADQNNWVASELDMLEFGANSLTMTPGEDNRTTAGYLGAEYQNEIFEVYFTAEDLDQPSGVWPGIKLRSSDPTSYSWLGNDGYSFIIKHDIFELQAWQSGQEFLLDFPNDGAVVSGQTHHLRVQALNTSNGVQLTFAVDGVIVAEHLDDNNHISGSGYVTLITPGTVVEWSGESE